MGREASGILLLVALGGCGLTSSLSRPATPITPATFTNTVCRDIARQRADDAAMNGYNDDALQIRIARDAYDNCVGLQRPRAGTGLDAP